LKRSGVSSLNSRLPHSDTSYKAPGNSGFSGERDKAQKLAAWLLQELCSLCLSGLNVELQHVPCHKGCPRGSRAWHPALPLSQASWPHWWTCLLHCRIRSGCEWCLKDVLFLRLESVPGSCCKALWEGCRCGMRSRGLPHKPHLCRLQCPSTDCSMSTWSLQAATLLWR